MKKRALFTTTVPVEVILAAGYQPVDLNNIFVSSPDSLKLVENAECEGFPGSSCAWIKGLYSVVSSLDFDKENDVFIAVTQGDCSNAKVLEEIVSLKTGIRTFIFNYPFSRNILEMSSEINRFSCFLNTPVKECEKARTSLSDIRKNLLDLDEISYSYPGLITGLENHLWLVSSSDFNGNPESFQRDLESFMKEVEQRKISYTGTGRLKIGYLGVPPIIPIHQFIEKRNATVVYNEIQREFAMLGESRDLADQYTQYTYPYSSSFRFSKAITEIKKRKLDGIIHYVQSFCHRQLEDIILRKMLTDNGIKMPLLTIEADKPLTKIDSRVSTRIEAFLETI
ncbi:MAG TPA: 2-hydroxyacyl-CoA dehydratase [bacterium]|nr:2-hydroxyacyl-CoA dehydratase [bacterium]HPS29008.1 2-hydroxyacyl-CoA dehydratase [bacterium]